MIPNSFIKDILFKTDIVDVIAKHVQLKQNGVNHSGLCPFHNEKSPSFTVNQDKQLYYCFGCGSGGNVFNFIMNYERLSFVEAVEQLAFKLGLEVPKQLQQDNDHLYSILNTVSAFYYEELKNNQDVIEYLKGRNITGKIAKEFSLGYSPDSFDALSNLFIDRQQYLIDTGMLVKKDNGQCYDKFRNRIMFPIKDIRGRVAGFGGRVINKDDKPKYLNSPETTIFNKSHLLYGLYEARKHLNNLDSLIVVEGYMDVISLACNEIWGAVATLGTAVNSNHINQLLRYASTIIFCFDGDQAGYKAAKKALESCLPLLKDTVSIKFMFLPQGEDPDSLIQKEGKDLFLQRTKDAMSLSDYLIQLSKDSLDCDQIEQRAKMISKARNYISQMPEGLIVKEIMASKINEMITA